MPDFWKPHINELYKELVAVSNKFPNGLPWGSLTEEQIRLNQSKIAELLFPIDTLIEKIKWIDEKDWNSAIHFCQIWIHERNNDCIRWENNALLDIEKHFHQTFPFKD